MLHPSTKKLIDRLIVMTAKGKIDWKEGEGDSVQYTTEGYGVILEIEPNEIVITAVDGRELERATASDIADVTNETGPSYTEQVASMTRDAIRKAKGIDKAITTLLAGIDLDGDGIPDIPVETLEAEIAEANDIIEDVGDETAAISVEDIDVEVETAGSGATSVEIISENEDTPTEDVTEAVARLAEEVNGRHTNDSEGDETVMQELHTEDAHQLDADGQIDVGVGEDESHDAEEDAVQTDISAEHTHVIETHISEHSEQFLEAETATDDDALGNHLVEKLGSGDEPDDIEEDTPEVISDVDVQPVTDTEQDGVLISEAREVSLGEERASDEEKTDATPLTDQAEAAAAALETVEPPADKEISLSGLGAGFGLGSLQTKGEASGIPNAEANEILNTGSVASDTAIIEDEAPEEEKVLIDATDEVALVDVISDTSKEPLTLNEEDGEPENTGDADEVSMTPKTRFNPWT